ncbi:MAG: carboxypeptidase-like regulatory domain-containing protein [Acidobacteria bacterium]|nr:carboxypeptidase-like regulatory domain-containing protein [Acidobacteriota bacterium]
MVVNRHKSTNVESDQEGQYTACLSPGTYDVSVNAQGFKSANRRRITVVDGERSIIDFPLKRARPQISPNCPSPSR